MLDSMPLDRVDPSLAVTEPLDLPKTESTDVVAASLEFDQLGLSSYARIVAALLRFMLVHRQVARQNLWVLRHVYALQTIADDCKKIGFANNAFLRNVLDSYLDEILSRAQQLAAYLWSSLAEDGWSKNIVKGVEDDAVRIHLEDSAKFVIDLVRHLRERDTAREARSLYLVLQHILPGCSAEEADSWVDLSRRIEKKGKRNNYCLAYVNLLSFVYSSLHVHSNPYIC
jgi:E3 ubiquitin-protein ligase listerin